MPVNSKTQQLLCADTTISSIKSNFQKKIDFKKVRSIREQTSRSGYFGWGVSLLSSVKDTKRSAF
jgi:hypothetical protein